jgi:hypothetical protein
MGFEYSEELDIKKLEKISFEMFLGLSPDEKKKLERSFRLENKNTLKIKQNDDGSDHYFKSFVSQQINFIAKGNKPKAISKKKILEQTNINLNLETKVINRLLKRKLEQLIKEEIIKDWYILNKDNQPTKTF